jgi:predicted RNase H-like HicB family nuclease
MNWTDERRLAFLLRLPWTLVAETTPEGDSLIRVAELPSAVGTGATQQEIERDLWDALTAALRAYLHFGDPIPVPVGRKLPWVEAAPAADEVRQRLPSPGARPAPETETAPFAPWNEQQVGELQAA